MRLLKLLSIAVPSYNSEDYLRRCLDTVVQGGKEVEVIVVDDGSTDHTADLAREYCRLYPDIVRLIQKENGGHGSAVNCGLQAAEGTFFKVVDSDDWLDPSAYHNVLKVLRDADSVDLVVTNYVYEYFYKGKSKCVKFGNVLPVGKVITFDEMKRFRISQFMIMHTMIYRTEVLRRSGLRLPEHTFYVDNIFAYVPLPFVNKLMYVDLDLYRYFIGRADQSVNTQVMIKRIDQQLRVTKIMADAYDLFADVPSQTLQSYMLHYLSIMVAISLIHLYLSENPEDAPKASELWEYLRSRDPRLYAAVRSDFVNRFIRLLHREGQHATRAGFRIARRIYKFS
jgi:glycosyltransferase involved in cell wall biosynthesis